MVKLGLEAAALFNQLDDLRSCTTRKSLHSATKQDSLLNQGRIKLNDK
jgi:hypothetical protein